MSRTAKDFSARLSENSRRLRARAMVTEIYCDPTGPLIQHYRGVLYIDDLNPETQMRWRMTRREMWRIGLRFLWAALRI
jgi:hypothetical protein